ncbi:MAG: hypothetical protein Kow00128_19470 [Deltaproteobacteria bacterium]
MLSLFPRQRMHIRAGRAGQATLLLLVTVSAILSVALAAVQLQHLGSERVAVANRVDAVALSAATWEARGLNVIAALNDGILQALRLIRWTCVVWAALAVAACFGAVGPFLEYSRRAPRILRSLWSCALQLSRWSDKVREAVPWMVLQKTASLSARLGIRGVLTPTHPRGEHDGKNTLELHVAPGPPISFAEAIFPITRVPRKIAKWKWAKKIARRVSSVIERALRGILGDLPGTIRMLVPEEDLPRRQRVRFAGGRRPSLLPAPFLPPPHPPPFADTAIGEVYGGGTTTMTWKSRLAPEGVPR